MRPLTDNALKGNKDRLKENKGRVRRYCPYLLRNMDWLTLVLFIILLTVSLVVLRSASLHAVESLPADFFFKRQAVYMVVGTALFLLTAIVDYQKYRDWWRIAYIGICILLLLVVLVGSDQGTGTKRWLFGFQPSELGKLVLIVVYAAYLEQNRRRLKEPKFVFKSMLLILVPMALVMIGDLGTSLVYFFIMLVMLFVAGANRKVMIGVCLFIVAAVTFVYVELYIATAGFTVMLEQDQRVPLIPLKSYQLMRLIVFINPEMAADTSGYHIQQSLIAIGSGGLLGQGYTEGTQVQGNFLPAHHTDFIFSVMGEEMGFFFTAAVLIVYMVFLLRLLHTAFMSRDIFGTLIVTGICSMIIIQVMINIGMTMSIMPITGLPLPFFSYGITSLWVNMMAVGLVFSVRLRTLAPKIESPPI